MSAPDLSLLPALDALLTETSVIRAARKMGLSPSAMSRTLDRLRATTGDPLLVRAGRGLVLTPRAEALRDRVRRVTYDALSVLQPDADALDPGTIERTFTIRANDGFVEAVGAKLVAGARAVAPGVRLCFTPKPDKDVRALREGGVDLEIGVLGDSGPEIRIQTLFRDRFVGVVRKGHPLLEAAITPQRYAACEHVVASRRGVKAGPVDRALAELGLSREVIAVVRASPRSWPWLRAPISWRCCRSRSPPPASCVPARRTRSRSLTCRWPSTGSRFRRCGIPAWTPTRATVGCAATC
jgi:DNA-binding transcriptional LysR family regulator